MGDEQVGGGSDALCDDQPEITAGRLHLRPWARDDAPVLIAAHQDPVMRAWLPHGFDIADEATALRWITERVTLWEYGHRASFAICDSTSGEILGAVEIRDLSFAEQCTVSYWVLPEHRGHGIAPHGLAAVSRWCFAAKDLGGLGQHRMTLTHALANHASCRVAEKAGFPFEGTMRASRRYSDGAYHDEHLHARLDTDAD